MLVRASNTQERTRVCVVLETQFKPKADRPDNTRPQTETEQLNLKECKGAGLAIKPA